MVKILACSANGYGTGLMMKMTLDKVIEICGFKVEEDAFNSIMEGRKIADAAAKGTVVLGLNNVMAQGEMTEALKNCGIDLK